MRFYREIARPHTPATKNWAPELTNTHTMALAALARVSHASTCNDEPRPGGGNHLVDHG